MSIVNRFSAQYQHIWDSELESDDESTSTYQNDIELTKVPSDDKTDIIDCSFDHLRVDEIIHEDQIVPNRAGNAHPADNDVYDNEHQLILPIIHDTSSDQSSHSIQLEIPQYNSNRPRTKREKLIQQDKIDIINKQKQYTQVFKFSYKNFSLILCFILISITGYFYPFNVFAKSFQDELGIMPSNVSFICSVGTGAFFMIGGFSAIYYDRYGPAYTILFGTALFFIGSLILSAIYQSIIGYTFLLLQFAIVLLSSGIGCVYTNCLLVVLKSASNRHRAKANCIAQCVWLLGAYITPNFNRSLYETFTGNSNHNEGKMILCRAVWTVLVFGIGAFFIREIRSRWWKHSQYNFKPYFQVKFNELYTLKQFRDINFICFILMGSFMLTGIYFYPSQLPLILPSFGESSNVEYYKEVFSFISAITAVVAGIGIDLLKWRKRPAIFLFFSIFLALISNTILIFNMYPMLLVCIGINAMAMGLFWASFPVMLCDIYGLNNLGTNLGVCLIIGSMVCGGLQCYAGEFYGMNIEDGGILCQRELCFRLPIVIVQGLIMVSFILLMTLRPRIPEKSLDKIIGVNNVQYINQAAENDFMESRLQNEELNINTEDIDIWGKDNTVVWEDAQAKEYLEVDDLDLSGIDMQSMTSSTKTGIEFSDDNARNIFGNEHVEIKEITGTHSIEIMSDLEEDEEDALDHLDDDLKEYMSEEEDEEDVENVKDEEDELDHLDIDLEDYLNS